MNLKDILAISGKPGLYKFISQGRNGIIVESFIDQKRMIVHSSAKVSALEDIAIYTETEEISLGDIFTKIIEKLDSKPALSHKSSPEELKSFFEEILPDYDKDRVYISDIKKVVNWYNILLAQDLLKLGEEGEGETKETETAETKSEKEPSSTNNTKQDKSK